MSERRIVNTNIRLNLDRPEDRQAWEYLQSLDRKKYRSYSRAVVTAVNDYFARQERLAADPYLETREKEDAFLEKVLDTIREGMQSSGTGLTGLATLLQGLQGVQAPPPKQEAMSDEDLDTAMEFIDSL
ncbi:MAG: hypothetical protein II680_03130 [Clostridia bacterium]|nr:hypothetical protein [Clostridia bacterium]